MAAKRRDVPVEPRSRYWYLLKHLPDALGMTSNIKLVTDQEIVAALDRELDRLYAANGLSPEDRSEAVELHRWYGVPLPKLTKFPEPERNSEPSKPYKPTAKERKAMQAARFAQLRAVAFEFSITMAELRHVLASIKAPEDPPSSAEAVQAALRALDDRLAPLMQQPIPLPNGKFRRVRASEPEPKQKPRILRIRSTDTDLPEPDLPEPEAPPAPNVVPITERKRIRTQSHWLIPLAPVAPSHSADVLSFDRNNPKHLRAGAVYRGSKGDFRIRGDHEIEPPDGPTAKSPLVRKSRRRK
ncbi:MAG: hypothetical protein AB7S41_01365 [Parvibaculaceae bacterium]